MQLIEGNPTIERMGQLLRLTLPCSRRGCPSRRDYALTRAQLTTLIAEGIDSLDAMDREAASAEVISMVRATA